MGDPVRAAELIYRVTREGKPPLRLVLGKPAIDLARKKFAQVEADIAAWEQLSIATAYPEQSIVQTFDSPPEQHSPGRAIRTGSSE